MKCGDYSKKYGILNWKRICDAAGASESRGGYFTAFWCFWPLARPACRLNLSVNLTSALNL